MFKQYTLTTLTNGPVMLTKNSGSFTRFIDPNKLNVLYLKSRFSETANALIGRTLTSKTNYQSSIDHV